MISSLKFLIIFSIFFVPGIIWNFIAIKYKHGRNRNPSDTIFIIQSIVLTVVTYFFVFLLFKIHNHSFNLFELFNNEIYNNSKKAISSDLVRFYILSIPIALFLSLVDLYLGKFDLFQFILGKLPLKPTERCGYEDVWERILFSKKNAWVSISDFENKIIYSGRIGYYSDTEKTRELSLEEVTIYNSKGDELYSGVSEMYISRPPESIIMEFLEETKGEDDEKK
ncbi:MAG: hypothetical protein IIT46_05070 [Lachnospiraceae bacterium]|nr:hypothetical protein [Lachnospiraceae bacterium]